MPKKINAPKIFGIDKQYKELMAKWRKKQVVFTQKDYAKFTRLMNLIQHRNNKVWSKIKEISHEIIFIIAIMLILLGVALITIK